MKIVGAVFAAAFAAGASLCATAPANAQYHAPPYSALLPPFEVMTIIRSMGFDPITRPVLRGPVYIVQALDDASIPVRITVDARSGNVVRVIENPPGPAHAGAPEANFGLRRLPRESVPPGAVYGPYDEDIGPPVAHAPPPKPKVAARTPLPRPAPPQSKAAATPPPESGMAAVMRDPKQTPGKSIPAPVANRAASSSSAPVTGSTGPAAPEANAAAPDAKPATPEAKAATPEATSDSKPTVTVPVAPLE